MALPAAVRAAQAAPRKPPADERHRQAAAYLASEGPQSLAGLAKGLGWNALVADEVVGFRWFERAGGKVHLTNEGRQVVLLGYDPAACE